MHLYLKIGLLILYCYCVMNGNDYRVVEQEHMHDIQSVASISKIMSAYIAIEQGNLNDKITIGNEIHDAYGSMVYLKEGDVVTLRTLLYGLMLRSGNDAAQSIAHHISGSQEAFVALMNEKAKQLGMTHTTFHNPSGLDEEDGGNLSCAYDMALLMSHAMKNKTFALISGSKYYKNEMGIVWKNKNRLLFEDSLVVAGKTGFTKKAGRTLVTSAFCDDISTIVVTLNHSDDFNFHHQKHLKAYQNTKLHVLLKKGIYEIKGKKYHVKEDVVISYDKNNPLNYQLYSDIDKSWNVEIMIKDQRFLYQFEEVFEDE